MVIRVRKTSTNPDFRGVNPSSEPRAVLHRSGRASFLPRQTDFRIGRASFLPRNADFRIGRAVFSPRAEDFRSGNPCFLPRAELFRPVGALLSRHRRHRSRRFFSFPIHYIYTRARGLIRQVEHDVFRSCAAEIISVCQQANRRGGTVRPGDCKDIFFPISI